MYTVLRRAALPFSAIQHAARPSGSAQAGGSSSRTCSELGEAPGGAAQAVRRPRRPSKQQGRYARRTASPGLPNEPAVARDGVLQRPRAQRRLLHPGARAGIATHKLNSILDECKDFGRMHSAFQDPRTQVDRSKIPRTEDFTKHALFWGHAPFDTIHGVLVLPELRPTASFKQRVRLATL